MTSKESFDCLNMNFYSGIWLTNLVLYYFCVALFNGTRTQSIFGHFSACFIFYFSIHGWLFLRFIFVVVYFVLWINHLQQLLVNFITPSAFLHISGYRNGVAIMAIELWLWFRLMIVVGWVSGILIYLKHFFFGIGLYSGIKWINEWLAVEPFFNWQLVWMIL